MVIKKFRTHHDFMWGYLRAVFKTFTRPAMVFLFFLAISILSLSAGGIFYFESATNPKITNFFDAFYYSVTIFTGVGLGDIAPSTTNGKILSMAMMLVGTAIYVCITAVVATTIINIEQNKN